MQAVPDAVVQPELHQPDSQLIGNQGSQPAKHQIPVDRIEKVVDVCIDQPGVAALVQGVHSLDGHPHRAPAPVGETAVVELLFEKGLEIGGHGGL